ncbi:MAG TPA: sn-glycerol-1-phosphate dehydrogenase, partial [Spirochaetales bacterium]|nr:sn-glycerol-1-phosphate dehydrogenase [Spirochaetales bacterium]
MEKLFSYAPEDIDIEAILASRQTWEQREADIKEMFPDEPLQNSILKISHSKWVEDDVLVKRLELLRSALPDLQVMFKDRLHSTAYVVEQLEKARCPVALKDLGITAERLKTTLVKAQMIRKRYTVLDVLYETGLLHKFIGELSL